ncbi:hypothetical protein MKW98_004927 [Papaver atlanticum]|uniref:Uncharacterized protein n=1 Tax=Papaver atlanticum TaxID=357466 RepID=A0AAD4SI74_9MAGN|nr:hypothetical protein MKW98_004927 [Papaver atlanticum]
MDGGLYDYYSNGSRYWEYKVLFLEFEKNQFNSQIDQLQNIVVKQRKLTGANLLSQEMCISYSGPFVPADQARTCTIRLISFFVLFFFMKCSMSFFKGN